MSSPIAQAPSPEDNLIYQQQDVVDEFDTTDTITQNLKLILRGKRMELDRKTLINLPESLLISMFPDGLVLSSPVHGSHNSLGADKTAKVVDFDPACLDYVLAFYAHAAQVRDENQQDAQLLADAAASSPFHHTLLNKQPIIVLREDLEYFCVPMKKGQEINKTLKLAGGEYLQQRNLIFDALENNVAEQHLIDMLCDGGFNRDDQWGYREIEPARTTIVSMALVLLKTIGPNNHTASAKKLLLFRRKPARKCWWDGNSVEINGETIRLWVRRTWTLESALV